MMWKIILAEDNYEVRQEIRKWLEEEPDFKIIGEASDGVEAVDLSNNMKPDLLITDLSMPLLNGIEVTKRVRQLSPKTRIIMLSLYGDKPYVYGAYKAGVFSYVLKQWGALKLIETIRNTIAGKKSYPWPLKSDDEML